MRRTFDDTNTSPPRARARRGPTRVAAGVLRLGAALAMLALLVALPIAVVALVGPPQRGALADAMQSGRLDDSAIVQIGTVLFLVLWAWFAATAVGEIVRVAAWRSRPRAAPLAPLSSSPTGWVRRMVRVAMISSTTAVGSGLIAAAGAGSLGHADATPRAASAATVYDGDIVASSTGSNTLRSTGRDTPYSVAVRLGDASLRERIIDMNRGRSTPTGAAWSGGVFPDGMHVLLPEGSLDHRSTVWTTYQVVEGDSVYRIAARLAAESSGRDGGRVRDVADEIIERNIGRLMNDGRRFDDPSLIRIGWQLEVPGLAEADVIAAPIAGSVSAPAVHVVRDGESYWSIAEDHLRDTGRPADGPQVAELTEVLVDLNAPVLGHSIDTLIVPGDEVRWPPIDVAVAPPADIPVVDVAPARAAVEPVDVVDAAAPTTTAPVTTTVTTAGGDTLTVPATAPTTTAPARRGAPVTTSLGAAVLLCAGALGLVESRRRHELRRAATGARLEPPTERDITTERLLRSLGAGERALRLDLALRSAGHHMAGTGAHVLAATMTDAGTIGLTLHRPGRAAPAAPWRADTTDPARWVLDDNVATDDLIDSARLAGQPCPALAHLGTLTGDDPLSPGSALFVDLEAFGLLSIDATDREAAVDIARAIAASFAASPVGETLRLVTHELDTTTHLGNLNAESAETIDAAIDCAAAALGSTPTAIGGRRTFELRARGVGGEAWEPVVVVSGADDHDPGALGDLVDVTRGGGRGLAAVLLGPIDGAGLQLAVDGGQWVVQPLGMRVTPVGLPAREVAAVHDLLDAADRPLAVDDDTVTTPAATRSEAPFVEQPWSLLVRVLGPADVIDGSGRSVEFDRGKALELAAWLSLHRERPTRGAARTALWDLQVRDATFANVVSDARRAMARAVAPPAGEEWIERTLTEQLPLHAMVATDADLLRARVDAARGRPAHEAIDVLRPGVEWITDLPFAGTGYLWPDAEGITSALTLLATGAATDMARHCLAIGDVDGVFWATGRGLLVLPGHEELIGLRMRAYAQRGDLAGVRNEWEVYERAIHADPWSSGEPSPKLVAIRRELLSR